MGGYASTDGSASERITLGLEWWLRRITPMARSAADHELVHCAQQGVDSRLQEEWFIQENLFLLRDRPWNERNAFWFRFLRLWARTEAPATLASPFWVATVLSLAVTILFLGYKLAAP